MGFVQPLQTIHLCCIILIRTMHVLPLVTRRLLITAAIALCSTFARAEASPPLTVFAAASLTDVLQHLGEDYTRKTGTPVRFSFAASSILARQVEAGARVDVFISADREWMDYLEQRGLLQQATRGDLVANALVLIAPSSSRVQLKIAPGFALRTALGGGRLATGDPDSVPVGRYAKQSLMTLGVWNDVADRLVRAEDVRHALMFVARGESPLGIVYATDVRVEPRVRIVDTFPASSHPPIAYPAAVVKGARPDAAKFLEFLRSDAARRAFEADGFKAVPH